MTRRRRRGKPKLQQTRQYQPELRLILQKFPFGPIDIARSHTHLYYTRESVHSKEFPLVKHPYQVYMHSIQKIAWAIKTYNLGRGIVMDCNKITLDYHYVIVSFTHNERQVMPLCTRYTLDMTSLLYGTDLLFSTHMFLQRHGKGGLERQSRQYERQLQELWEQWIREAVTIRW